MVFIDVLMGFLLNMAMICWIIMLLLLFFNFILWILFGLFSCWGDDLEVMGKFIVVGILFEPSLKASVIAGSIGVSLMFICAFLYAIKVLFVIFG